MNAPAFSTWGTRQRCAACAAELPKQTRGAPRKFCKSERCELVAQLCRKRTACARCASRLAGSEAGNGVCIECVRDLLRLAKARLACTGCGCPLLFESERAGGRCEACREGKR